MGRKGRTIWVRRSGRSDFRFRMLSSYNKKFHDFPKIGIDRGIFSCYTVNGIFRYNKFKEQYHEKNQSCTVWMRQNVQVHFALFARERGGNCGCNRCESRNSGHGRRRLCGAWRKDGRSDFQRRGQGTRRMRRGRCDRDVVQFRRGYLRGGGKMREAIYP